MSDIENEFKCERKSNETFEATMSNLFPKSDLSQIKRSHAIWTYYEGKDKNFKKFNSLSVKIIFLKKKNFS